LREIYFSRKFSEILKTIKIKGRIYSNFGGKNFKKIKSEILLKTNKRS